MAKKIQAIIFDLGNVIVQTDLQKTITAFKKMSKIPDDLTIGIFFEDYKLFELGKITQKKFLKIKQTLSINEKLASIEEAWNSMILDDKNN